MQNPKRKIFTFGHFPAAASGHVARPLPTWPPSEKPLLAGQVFEKYTRVLKVWQVFLGAEAAAWRSHIPCRCTQDINQHPHSMLTS